MIKKALSFTLGVAGAMGVAAGIAKGIETASFTWGEGNTPPIPNHDDLSGQLRNVINPLATRIQAQDKDISQLYQLMAQYSHHFDQRLQSLEHQPAELSKTTLAIGGVMLSVGFLGSVGALIISNQQGKKLRLLEKDFKNPQQIKTKLKTLGVKLK